MMFVDPIIGSGGIGYGAGGINPGAQVPFGSLRLGPDTALGDRDIVLSFQHSGGYAHSDNRLRAFSHTHLVGAGASDYGNFGVVPIRFGDNPSENVLRAALLEPANRTLPFDHSNEHACRGTTRLACRPSEYKQMLLLQGRMREFTSTRIKRTRAAVDSSSTHATTQQPRLHGVPMQQLRWRLTWLVHP